MCFNPNGIRFMRMNLENLWGNANIIFFIAFGNFSLPFAGFHFQSWESNLDPSVFTFLSIPGMRVESSALVGLRFPGYTDNWACHLFSVQSQIVMLTSSELAWLLPALAASWFHSFWTCALLVQLGTLLNEMAAHLYMVAWISAALPQSILRGRSTRFLTGITFLSIFPTQCVIFSYFLSVLSICTRCVFGVLYMFVMVYMFLMMYLEICIAWS